MGTGTGTGSPASSPPRPPAAPSSRLGAGWLGSSSVSLPVEGGNEHEQKHQAPHCSLPKSSSYSQLLLAAGDFDAIQELSSTGATRPLEEEDTIIDRVEGILRARFCPQPPSAEAGGAEAVAVPAREFLRTCLRVWQYRDTEAARVAGNFAAFRTKHHWPYRISARSVESELRSEVHWLLEGHDKLGRGILVYNARHVLACLNRNGRNSEKWVPKPNFVN
jgi:hypothetical protein